MPVRPEIPEIVTGQLILVALANHWRLRLDELTGRRKIYQLCRRRHIAMGLMRRYTAMSFPEIARLFGGRDHSSVIYGDRVYRRLRVAGDRMAVEAGHVVRGLFRAIPKPPTEVRCG